MEAGIELSASDSPTTPQEKADMLKCFYGELVGSIQYVAQGSRADVVYAIGRLSKFLANPGRKHWNAAVRVVRYLKTNRRHRLRLGGTPGRTCFSSPPLTCNSLASPALSTSRTLPAPQILGGMTDSNYAGCTDTRPLVSGYAFSLGSGAVSWKSRQQPLITLSTCEAEYVAASEAVREAVFLRNLLAEIGDVQRNPTLMLADNQGTTVLASDQTNHARTKHIDTRYRYVSERTADGIIAF